jgi:hypothetical protein
VVVAKKKGKSEFKNFSCINNNQPSYEYTATTSTLSTVTNQTQNQGKVVEISSRNHKVFEYSSTSLLMITTGKYGDWKQCGIFHVSREGALN